MRYQITRADGSQEVVESDVPFSAFCRSKNLAWDILPLADESAPVETLPEPPVTVEAEAPLALQIS